MRLVNSNELARLFGVTPSAVSNWRKRGTSPLGKNVPLPEPKFTYQSRYGRLSPLWTVEQVEEMLAAIDAKRRQALIDFRKESL